MKSAPTSPSATTRNENRKYVRESIYRQQNGAFRNIETSAPRPVYRPSAGPRPVTLLPMKALVISRLGDPGVLEVRDVPDAVPLSGQELVKAQAGGVNFADIMTAQGGYPGTPPPPLVAGREFCGIRASDGQHVMGL